MAYGIGQEIEELTELGVPALTQMQSVNPQLKYALALQEATNIVNAAARERDMAMEQPQPPQVVGQLEQGLAERLMPGAQQMAQQMPPQPMPMQPGVAGVPAPNMMMAGGGIVSFADGGMPVGNNQPIPKLMQKYGSDVVMRFLEGQQRFRNIEGNVSPQAREQFEMEKANFMSGFPVEFIQDVLQTQSGSLDISEEVLNFDKGGLTSIDPRMLGTPLLPPVTGLLDAAQAQEGLTNIENEESFLSKLKRYPLYSDEEGPFMKQFPEVIQKVRRYLPDQVQNARWFSNEILLPQLKAAAENDPTIRERFNRAFREARSKGRETFEFMGGDYHTKYVEEMASGGIVGFANRGLVKAEDIDMDNLLNALMMTESSGDPNAVGRVGELGAYQIRPSTAAQPGLGVAPFTGDLFDPEASRNFSREYLQALLDRYDGDVEAALIAYNAGYQNADNFVAGGRDYEELPQPDTTRPHVRKIMSNANADSANDLIARRTLNQEADAEAEMNLLDAAQDRRDAFFDLLDSGGEKVSPGEEAAMRRSALREEGVPLNMPNRELRMLLPELAESYDAEQQADAEAEMNLLDAAQGRRDAFFDLINSGMESSETEPVNYAEEIGSAYRDLTGGTGLNNVDPRSLGTPLVDPVMGLLNANTDTDADAEAEINLLNAAQDRRNSTLELLESIMGPTESEEVSSYVPPNKGDYGMVYGPGDMLRDANVPNEYNPFSVLSPGNISDTVRRMRQRGAETVERRRALAEANPSLSTEDIAALDEQLQSNVTSERNQTAPNLYQYGTEDIVEEGQVSPNLYQYGTEEIVEEDQNGNNVVDEIIEQQMESGAKGAPGSDAKYRTPEEITDRDVYGDQLSSSTDGTGSVNTGSGRYEVIGTDDNNSIAQRPMSIQEQYNQLTQPQSGTEAFFDLLQTLGGGAGRSKGYEAAGIMQQAQDRDQLEQIEALALIEAQNRADAITAQNQTDMSRFVENYITANASEAQTRADLFVEASQLYLTSRNIYAGQIDKAADFRALVENRIADLTDSRSREYKRVRDAQGANSPEAKALLDSIIQESRTIFEAGEEFGAN
jgi:hypothetical protein